MLATKLFDHTILKADATKEDVKKVCEEAMAYSFCSVCVNSYYVPYVAELLHGSDVKICTVVGFPLGAMSTRAKALEAKIAVMDGADEVVAAWMNSPSHKANILKPEFKSGAIAAIEVDGEVYWAEEFGI